MPAKRHPPGDPPLDTVQPVIVEEAELRGAASPKLEARMARLEADAGLLVNLALHNFEGREWESFSQILVRYAHAVLYGWIRSGKIHHVCRAKGVPVTGIVVQPSKDDSHDLAEMVTAVALRAFRERVLIPGRWSAARGATLATYFVGQCLFHFSFEYRTWLRAHLRSRPVQFGLASAGELEHLSGMIASPATGAELNRVMTELRTDADNQQDHESEILLSAAVGFEHEEISREFGLPSKRAVEGVCYRRREKWR